VSLAKYRGIIRGNLPPAGWLLSSHALVKFRVFDEFTIWQPCRTTSQSVTQLAVIHICETLVDVVMTPSMRRIDQTATSVSWTEYKQ
jgi:hypothetical protein